ncbi:cell division protein FtsK [Liquorilactobacillus sucicola DSM 21376 = JCM 15457]|uniref:DNA translocase FtsK n=1 Tax=Liquorilactobacillus sucicola TaxID=519050 RepID=UPI000432D2A1|nr:DNA translocase FtsK [Liquorilactobacillus sucicola]GAJ25952.1 cell division protein FtsK [Liquorilactobacillus sucicola DSM 21376 = JCM 15457]
MAQRKRKRRTTSRKSEFISKRTSGGLFILVGLLGFLKLGYVGILCVNIFRLFIGDAYPAGQVVLIILGAYLLLTGKEPQPKKHYLSGAGVMLASGLLLLHSLFFQQLELHSNFISITWQYLRADIAAGSIGSRIGGGLLGALLYTPSYFLFSQIGTYIVTGVAFVVGACIFSGFPVSRVLEYCGKALYQLLAFFRETLRFFMNKLYQGFLKLRHKIAAVQQTRKKERVVEKESSQPEVQPEKEQNNNGSEEKVKITQSENAAVIRTDTWNTGVEQDKSNSKENKDEQTTKKGLSFGDNPVNDDYKLPPATLLQRVDPTDQSGEYQKIEKNTQVLKKTFNSFGVDVDIKSAILGPAVTKYELHPAIGVKVSKIVNLADDLALALAAKDIRIEAPIPGKSLIGIEVPNQKVSTVSFRDIIEAQKKQKSKPLEVPLGRDISGKLVTADLAKMPHLLIAGSTGSGKSVAINGIITSLLMNCPPHLVKLMLVDPKKVELGVYNGIPHLLTPVVTNPKKASKALHKLVAEMERRYELFANTGQRNIAGYNEMIQRQNSETGSEEMLLPYIVIVVDELSDLMMVAANEVEDAIIRLAQMARAAGIHMILATQRPSVDVITGLIKANVPSRIAFAVSSGTDSRTIIDTNGAEKLLGRGDMLFLPMGLNKPIRVQGAFISDNDVASVVDFVKQQQSAEYDESLIVSDEETTQDETEDSEDELFNDAVQLIVKEQACSISMLQRRFRIGYNRAARLVDEMEAKGMVGPSEGSKPRKVYLSNDTPPE